MPDDQTAIYLDLIAAKARQLSDDLRAGRLWPGQLSYGLNDIREQLDKCREVGGHG